MMTTIDYATYKKLRSEGKLNLGIDNNLAMRLSELLPTPQRRAVKFWNTVANLMFPAALILGYLYSWWWLLLFIGQGILANSNKKTASEFVMEFADTSPEFYEKVRSMNGWMYQHKGEKS